MDSCTGDRLKCSTQSKLRISFLPALQSERTLVPPSKSAAFYCLLVLLQIHPPFFPSHLCLSMPFYATTTSSTFYSCPLSHHAFFLCPLYSTTAPTCMYILLGASADQAAGSVRSPSTLAHERQNCAMEGRCRGSRCSSCSSSPRNSRSLPCTCGVSLSPSHGSPSPPTP